MGYDGDLELALIPESFRTDVLKEEADNNEVLVENAHSETAAFALFSLLHPCPSVSASTAFGSGRYTDLYQFA